jgi:hypothetical protein
VASNEAIDAVKEFLDAASSEGQLVSPGFEPLDWMEIVVRVSDDDELADRLTWAFDRRDLSTTLRSHLTELLAELRRDAD